MEAIWIDLSNAVNGAALVIIMTMAVLTLNADRFKGEGITLWPFNPEQFSLYLILVGAFFQLTTLHNPLGTAWDMLVLRVGLASWMVLRSYKYITTRIW